MKTSRILICLTSVLIMLMSSNCGHNKKPAGNETASVPEAGGSQTEEPAIPDSHADIKGKPLGVISGIIEYKYSGDKTGKSTHYFDDYGMKSAVYTEIVSEGEESKGWAVSIGEDQYMWDPSNPGQGMKTKNPTVKMMADASGKDILTYMAGIYEQMGMTESGTEMWEGKECTVFKGSMGKVLIWKGIMMKLEMNIGTMVSRQEVTSIKTNVHVDGKYFRIPDNITFSEIPGF